MKRVTGNVALDVRKQIFVRCDAESGRSTLPLDFKSASQIDISDGADCAFIRSDTAIASNAYPVASSRQGGTHRERNNRYLLHANMISLITMQQRVILDSTNVQGGGVSPERPCGGRETAAPCTHGTIFIFTASTTTSST